MSDNEQPNVNVITPKARLSYPHLFEPSVPKGLEGTQEPAYNCMLVFDKDADLQGIKDAILAAAREKFGDKAVQVLKAGEGKGNPLKTNWEEKKLPEGSRYISARAKQKPNLRDRYKGADGYAVPITNPDVLYAGCDVRASLRAFAYDTAGNRGVSFHLSGVQKLGENTRLDRPDPNSEFDATEEAPAEMDGPEGVCAQFGCENKLTADQYRHSMAEFGRPLCPKCAGDFTRGEQKPKPASAPQDDNDPFAP